jgi:hypothetical protein
MFRTTHQPRAMRGRLRLTTVAGLISAIMPIYAHAYKFNTSPDWDVNWDNTFSYNLGMRTQGIDPMIGNNPQFDDGDYKFRHAGDIVTNRVTVLSEFSAAYQGFIGFKLSGSAWKDFAYGSGDNTNPGMYAPGLPYRSLQSYANGHYGSYTNRYYVQGAQLLDGFAFYNTEIGGKAIYLKAGQFTEYWGNSLFFPFAGISYAQSAIDGIKAYTVPGTSAKELALPRPQISVTAQITPEVALSAQYALGWYANRLPTGGTYYGPVDSVASGPTNLFLAAVPSPAGFVPVMATQASPNTPPQVDNNFGFKLSWTPSFLQGGAMGFYYRRLDESQPWVLGSNFKGRLPSNYVLTYNRGAQLLGYSLDQTIGSVSTGFEASWRHNTALNTTSLSPAGAKGDVLNIVANAMVPLSRSPLWDTGTFTAELGYTHLLSVRQNPQFYNGIGSGYGCGANGNKWNGCSTNDYVGLAFLFQPQWLQVFPGVDLSMPISDTIGLYGNSAINGPAPQGQGTHTYSIGLQANIRQRTTVTLSYIGYFAHVNTTAKTPLGAPYNATGNGLISLNDRPWVSLVVQSSF